MDWLNSLFGDSLGMGVKLAILFVVLLFALLLVFWLFRKIFGDKTARLSKSRQPRLSVTDAAVVDEKRRLVLVRRDNVEHLVMIGGPSDIVVEQNIVRTAPVPVPATPELKKSDEPEEAITTPPEPNVSNNDSVIAGSVIGVGAAAAVISQNANDTGEMVTEEVAENEFAVTDNVIASNESVDSNLDIELADDLENALGLDDDISVGNAPSVDDDKNETNTKTETEMQKLLDELTA